MATYPAATTYHTGVRPTGVTILSVLYFLKALLSLISGVLVLGVLSLIGPIGVAIGTIIGGALIMIGLIQMIIVWGLWTGRGWARFIAIIFTILSILADIGGTIALNPLSMIGLVISVIILWYLFQPQVKAFYA
ncbi:MAG: hypothetical protein GX307_02835 [Euryarchaeota archaeon]|nr:hypothetical protein [Euryarchaeota archaeon]